MKVGEGDRECSRGGRMGRRLRRVVFLFVREKWIFRCTPLPCMTNVFLQRWFMSSR